MPFFSDSFSRAFGFPDVRLINLISESTPVREERPYAAYVGLREAHYSRPGLVAAQNYGAGPIRGLYFDPAGGGAGSLFVVSQNTIYRNGGSVGTLPGTDLVRFAASPSQVVAVAGGYAYLWDGMAFASFTLIANNVLPNVSDVAYLAGRFVFTDTGSAQWTYSEINDAGNETGLDFANNNASAAPNLAVRVLNDQLAFFTTTNVEFWSPNGDTATDATTPFIPDIGARLSARRRGPRHGSVRRQFPVLGRRQWGGVSQRRRADADLVVIDRRQAAAMPQLGFPLGPGGQFRGPRVLCAEHSRGGNLRL